MKLPLLIALLLLAFGSYGQAPTISPAAKEKAIHKVATLIKEHYLFPAKADSITTQLNHRLAVGAYDTLATYRSFTTGVVKDLWAISGDYHFSFYYNPKGLPDKKEKERQLNGMDWYSNHGLSKLEVLKGNVGYLKLDYFARPNKRVIKSALRCLERTGGMVIDLRDNHGGTKAMVGLLASYFVKGKELLATAESPHRKNEKVTTQRFTSIGRMDNAPVAILINDQSFSAAEFFCYAMQQLNRAVVVGDTTKGGAHPVERHQVSDSLIVSIPYGRMVSPVTNSNWEGTGIVPDIVSDYNQTLTDGHLWVLEQLKGKAMDASSKQYYQKYIDEIKKEAGKKEE